MLVGDRLVHLPGDLTVDQWPAGEVRNSAIYTTSARSILKGARLEGERYKVLRRGSEFSLAARF